MSFWESLKTFMAVEPMQVRAEDSAFEFTDLQAQIWALQGRAHRPWRTASVEEALGVPAIFRAVSLIANVTGSLSMEGFRNGALLADPPRIIVRPNPFSTPRDFYRDTAYYMASRGEAWWWVAARGTDGEPLSLFPVPPWEVSVSGNPKNRLLPKIEWQGRTMPNADMRHITYLPDRSRLRGVGPLQVCGAAASVTVEAQEWAANFFAGNIPSIIGETDADLDENDLEALDAQWAEKGSSNTPRWMAGGIKLRDFGIDPAKAQLGEAREFQVGETARMFGMPGPLLEYSAPGSSLTYQNNASVWAEFQAGCLSPYYLEPIEQEMSDLLSRSTVARFSIAGLLRADIKTRYEVYAMGVASGVLTPEAAQASEGIIPGNVDYAAVPPTPPAAIPSVLPPDSPIALRSLDDLEELRCPMPCGRLAGRFAGAAEVKCSRCGRVLVKAA